MRALTQAQQKLVEENHNLIYGFAKQYNIDADEFYGDLAIGLCHAAAAYDKSKGNFSTLAYVSMLNEYRHHYNAQNRQKVIPDCKVTSLYTSIRADDEGGEDITYERIIPDRSVDVESEVVTGTAYQQMVSKLDERKQGIAEMLLKGSSQTEIAKHYGVSTSWINAEVSKIRTQLRALV